MSKEGTEITVGLNDDYACVYDDNLQIYYGYEKTACGLGKTLETCELKPNEDDCEDCFRREWCFVIEKDGKEIFKRTKTEIAERFEQSDCEQARSLLAGLLMYVEETITKGK